MNFQIILTLTLMYLTLCYSKNVPHFKAEDVGLIVHEADMPQDLQDFVVKTMKDGYYYYYISVWQIAAYMHTQLQKNYKNYTWLVSANYEQIAYPYYHKMLLSPAIYDHYYLVTGLLLDC
ncbi:uncharacterized protein [Onthophagus taurus]|uniref:uncharacterized protein n=1 Tax=Onthophagus taurus TaxID=166361 RepID=UPI000C208D62|nr:uncharacterized protein LOC111425790 [Onthophagus taurus]